MLIIQVVVNEKDRRTHGNGSLRSTICPYCGADVYFDVVSPVYCVKCHEILEPLSDIEGDVEQRIWYYKSTHSERSIQCFG